MDLQLLRKFLVVAEELHFGRAATRLHIAQSPLSQQIRRLETELGVTLFTRTTRNVTLTAAGEAFMPEARALLAHADRAREIAAAHATGKRGRLRLSYVGSAAFEVLPRLLRSYRRSAPDVEIDLREHTTAEQLDALAAGNTQIALLRHTPVLPGVSSCLLRTEPLLAALPTGHRLAGRAVLPVEMLAEESFILFPRDQGPTFHDQLISLCHQAGFAPRIRHETRHMATTVSLVAAGLGISLVPASVRALRTQDITYVPLADTAAGIDLTMAWRTDAAGPTVHRFIECARAWIDHGEIATSRAGAAPAG
ncbi:LysR family transcriptional regulator [Nocardia goodfellowii]|uniref:DNA-binding transcriptional LysR family regulator n=1 Tax=Nocardia goodfellowii TaxID=882446 RepID=A0ABS4QIY1_9NOCA|nr:LysR family transcriptional regulator [Nocardia goodfellowii]MBP2191033.1 DNA-binding transcriptional LysR family regulator [Nocardia goodfellowii]